MKGASGVKGKQARLITSNTSGKYISLRWPWRQQLLPLSSCVDSIKEHLRDVSQTSVASEKEPILARVGFFDDSDRRSFASCPKHRAEFGVRFRPTTKCQHPLRGNQRQKAERGINLKMAKEIKARRNTVFPGGAGILDCVLHLVKVCYIQILRT